MMKSLKTKAETVIKRNGLKFFIKITIVYLSKILKNLVFLPYVILKIKKVRTDDINELMNLSFNDFFGIIKPYQEPHEILSLLNILNKRKPKNILEIGTANGGTLFMLCKVADKNANIVSIDLPGGSFGGGYPKWKIPLYKSFKKDNQKLYLIRSDSHKKETVETVQRIISPEKFDFIFIDGDHSYNGVKTDFLNYKNLINDEGLIAFHDIVTGPQNAVGGAFDFWKEIKKGYKHEEIVYDYKQQGGGIGILNIND